MKANLLGIDIEFISYDELLKSIFFSEIKTVTYANQYVLNESSADESLKHSLQNFDLVHPDGIGVQKAFKYLYGKVSETVTGSDLYYKIFDHLNKSSLSVFIYGSRSEVLEKAVEYIKTHYKNVIIKGFIEGYSDLSDEDVIGEINKSNPYILFVATGTPRQEVWIIKNRNLINAEKIISIGGGLRVISGDRSRGPVFIQKLGLEWLVRLIEEPFSNFRRYIIGIPLFVYRINKQRKH